MLCPSISRWKFQRSSMGKLPKSVCCLIIDCSATSTMLAASTAPSISSRCPCSAQSCAGCTFDSQSTMPPSMPKSRASNAPIPARKPNGTAVSSTVGPLYPRLIPPRAAMSQAAPTARKPRAAAGSRCPGARDRDSTSSLAPARPAIEHTANQPAARSAAQGPAGTMNEAITSTAPTGCSSRATSSSCRARRPASGIRRSPRGTTATGASMRRRSTRLSWPAMIGKGWSAMRTLYPRIGWRLLMRKKPSRTSMTAVDPRIHRTSELIGSAQPTAIA